MSISPGERVALVTGSSSGIGRAVADQLLAVGWTVVGMARRSPEISHPGYRHLALDLADLGAVTGRVERELTSLCSDPRCRRLGLVNNAAVVGRAVMLDGTDAAELLSIYAINVVAPTWLMAFLVRCARADTALRIVNVSTGAATRAMPGMGAYSGSKAALRMASMSAAADLESDPLAKHAPSDAAVLSYSPGIVDTPMQLEARSRSPEVWPMASTFKQWHAEGALAAPSLPAAEIVAFLESPAGQPRFAEQRRG